MSAEDDRPVTIYTVAERAGVSIATVSRVLKGSTPASPMTRRKVLRAVEELDYVANAHARALAGRHSGLSESILGYRGREELIHRDDLVLT